MGLESKVDKVMVLVHGIGSQTRGSQLTAWGGPILRWIEETQGLSHTIVRASDGAWAGPAYMDVDVTIDGENVGGPSTIRLRLIEALWADAVVAPRFRELLTWAFTIMPVVVPHHLTAIMRAYPARIAADLEAQQPMARRIRGLLRSAWAVVALPVFLLALVLLGAVVLLLMTTILAVGLVGKAVPVARDVAVKLQAALTESLGDTAYLQSGSIQKAIVTGRVKDAISIGQASVANPADMLVVAHSQGAAVTFYALTEGQPPAAPVRLVTLGQGLAKIRRLTVDRARPWSQRSRDVLLPVLGTLLTAVAVVIVISRGAASDLGEAARLIVFGVAPPLLGFGLLCLGVIAARGSTAFGALVQGLAVVGGADPPPSGPSGPVGPTREQVFGTVGPPAEKPQWRLPPEVLQLMAAFRPLLQAGLYALVISPAIGVLAAYWAFVRAVPDRVDFAAALAIAVLILLLSAAAIYAERHPADEPLGAHEHISFWRDYFATSDPVSNGPLHQTFRSHEPIPPSTRYASIAVVNRESILTDHTTYWENQEHFVSAVMAEVLPDTWILQASGTEPQDLVTAGLARRQKLGYLLWYAKPVTYVAFIAAFAVGPMVRAEPLLSRLPDVLPDWVGGVAARSDGSVERVLIASLAAFLAADALTRFARWRARSGWSAQAVPAPATPRVEVTLPEEDVPAAAAEPMSPTSADDPFRIGPLTGQLYGGPLTGLTGRPFTGVLGLSIPPEDDRPGVDTPDEAGDNS